MKIQRINTYDDVRFSEVCLKQHGCFEVGEELFEIEIISLFEAIIQGTSALLFEAVIEEYRFYTEHITTFYDKHGKLVKQYDRIDLFPLSLNEIQPSQFYVDSSKLKAIASFIENEEDIVIPVVAYQGRYLSLDGHTRLYYASQNGFTKVQAYISECDKCIFDFACVAQKRKILTPYDLQVLSHEEYELKWNMYCDNYFNNRKEQD